VIGVLGGTFDPVHHGHLRLALEVAEVLALEEVRLIPAHQPPHRPPPVAAAQDRLALLEAVLRGAPRLRADRRELDRPGPSYTVDTLASLRAEVGPRPLCLLLGMDAFRSLDTWHRWREIPRLAHLAVARRPGGRLPVHGPVAELLAGARIDDPGQLRERPAGSVALVEVPPLAISATRIRALLASGRDPRWLLPDPAIALIRERGLYLARR
jgi:nicotinate-nucleotide adenylyltransferase